MASPTPSGDLSPLPMDSPLVSDHADEEEDDIHQVEEDDMMDSVEEHYLKMAQDEHKHSSDVNSQLQKAILKLWEDERAATLKSKIDDITDAKQHMRPNQLTKEYRKTLNEVKKKVQSIEESRSVLMDKIDHLNAELDVKDEAVAEDTDIFKREKREIARSAVFSRTGKPIRMKRILALEDEEEKKDKELENVRLKNMHYLNQLQKLKHELKHKERLADGLHLIDFEQLKIENQTLNEKIEERNDEVHKLRKKTTTTVHILTHVKEKLTFVEASREQLSSELAEADSAVTSLRDQLTRAKHTRDVLRAENAELKAQQGFVGSDMLVADFENRKASIQQLKSELADLQKEYVELTQMSRVVDHATRRRSHVQSVPPLVGGTPFIP